MGKILPSLQVKETENQTKYIYVFGGQYQKMAAGEVHLSALLENRSARLECEKGYWGDAGSWRFPFHPEK